MEHAFEKVGTSRADAEIWAAITRYLNNGGTIERLREIVALAAERMPGTGQSGRADTGHVLSAHPRHPNDDAEGHASDAAARGQLGSAPASSTESSAGGHSEVAAEAVARTLPPVAAPDRERGATIGMPQGQSASAPSREPTAAQRRAAGAVAKKAAETVLDTFGITERQGSKTAVGDIPVARYPSLLRTLGRRAWVSSREYNLLYLLKSDADKQAHIPVGALTREVFDAKTVAAKIDIATDLALPKAEASDAA